MRALLPRSTTTTTTSMTFFLELTWLFSATPSQIRELAWRRREPKGKKKNLSTALLAKSSRDFRQRVQAEQSQVASTKVTVKQEQARASSAMTKRISSAVQRQEALKSEVCVPPPPPLRRRATAFMQNKTD